jgi:hypothetical protein
LREALRGKQGGQHDKILLISFCAAAGPLYADKLYPPSMMLVLNPTTMRNLLNSLLNILYI